jgi:hypothetical protein
MRRESKYPRLVGLLMGCVLMQASKNHSAKPVPTAHKTWLVPVKAIPVLAVSLAVLL